MQNDWDWNIYISSVSKQGKEHDSFFHVFYLMVNYAVNIHMILYIPSLISIHIRCRYSHNHTDMSIDIFSGVYGSIMTIL